MPDPAKLLELAARRALQEAWDRSDTLPSIIFTDDEADQLVTAIARALAAKEGE